MNTPTTNRLMVARDLAGKKKTPPCGYVDAGPINTGGKRILGGKGHRNEAQATTARVA